jgi:hypothetical protein
LKSRTSNASTTSDLGVDGRELPSLGPGKILHSIFFFKMVKKKTFGSKAGVIIDRRRLAEALIISIA